MRCGYTWTGEDEQHLSHVTVGVERARVRTSIVVNHRQSIGKAESSGGNTYLMGEAGPPYDKKNPDFVEDWDVSVLRRPGVSQHWIV